MYFFICRIDSMALGLLITIDPKCTCYNQIVDITCIYFVNTKGTKFFKSRYNRRLKRLELKHPTLSSFRKFLDHKT